MVKQKLSEETGVPKALRHVDEIRQQIRSRLQWTPGLIIQHRAERTQQTLDRILGSLEQMRPDLVEQPQKVVLQRTSPHEIRFTENPRVEQPRATLLDIILGPQQTKQQPPTVTPPPVTPPKEKKPISTTPKTYG